MEKITQKDIDWLLKPKESFSFTDLPKEERPPKSDKKKGFSQVFLWITLIVTMGIVPFFLLIRTSVYLNLEQGLNGWLALSGGAIATIVLLLIYILFLFRKVRNKKLMMKFSFGGLGMLVGGFCIYGLLYLSSVNAKSDEIREVYRSLHPILRVAVATTTLAEGGLVITDIKRTPEDYARMGLPLNESSLHFEQSSGYVHAIDLRTRGHSEIRNQVLEKSLKFMGLQTIRHVGTADHLHVALPLNN